MKQLFFFALAFLLVACGNLTPAPITTTATATFTFTVAPTSTLPSTATREPTATATEAPHLIPDQLAGLNPQYKFANDTLTFTNQNGEEVTVLTMRDGQVVIKTAEGEQLVSPELIKTVVVKDHSPDGILTVTNKDDQKETTFFFLPDSGEWVAPISYSIDSHGLLTEGGVPEIGVEKNIWTNQLTISELLNIANGKIPAFPEKAIPITEYLVNTGLANYPILGLDREIANLYRSDPETRPFQAIGFYRSGDMIVVSGMVLQPDRTFKIIHFGLDAEHWLNPRWVDSTIEKFSPFQDFYYQPMIGFDIPGNPSGPIPLGSVVNFQHLPQNTVTKEMADQIRTTGFFDPAFEKMILIGDLGQW